MRSDLDVPALRAAWWALRALRRARRALRRGGLAAARLPEPPRLPAAAGRGVEAVLRRRAPTCLERSLVRQRWLAAQGRRVDVVIGVTAPARGFRAHAWLEGEEADGFSELTRVAP